MVITADLYYLDTQEQSGRESELAKLKTRLIQDYAVQAVNAVQCSLSCPVFPFYRCETRCNGLGPLRCDSFKTHAGNSRQADDLFFPC